MKNVPDADLPDLLRRRIQRQRKRQKFVRASFAVTAVVSVLLLFAANQITTLSPSARGIEIVQIDPLTLIDQHLDITRESDPPTGSFALLRVKDGAVSAGQRYDGVVRGANMLDAKHVGVTTDSRFMVFDISGDSWERTELRSLGLNDPTAAPVVVKLAGTLWMCWVNGADVMVSALGRDEVEPGKVAKADAGGAELAATVSGGTIWLAMLKTRSNELTLMSFTPSIGDADKQPPGSDADSAEAILTVKVEQHFNGAVTDNVRQAQFAIIDTPQGARPVVGVVRKVEGNRAWQMLTWTRDEKDPKGAWRDAEPPPRVKPIGGLELSNFMALAPQGNGVLAVFSEAGEVKRAFGTPDAKGAIAWSEPELIPLDKTNGPTIYIIWITVLFAVVLTMASQGVWLLLNRERPMDRTLAEILDNQEKEASPAAELPKLLYASPFARAISLLLDVAITSPVVILLQGVYGYTWEQAYGFLAVGTVMNFDANLWPMVQATAVTLLVLAIYGMVCELAWGRTFGKALFKLRVVDADGEAPAAWRIVVRNFVKIFELIHWAVLLIPMGIMMISGRQQRLGDLVAGTFVIVDVIPDEAPDDIDI